MKHLVLTPSLNNNYSTAIIIKEAAFNPDAIRSYYERPLLALGHKPNDMIAFGLIYAPNNKAPAKVKTPCIEELLSKCDKVGVKNILCADGEYFKTLAKQSKSEPHHGYIMPCGVKGYEHINIILSVNYQALFYNPAIQPKLDMSLNTLVQHTLGTHTGLGNNVIHSAVYCKTVTDTVAYLESLHKYSELTCDIETFSLAIDKARLGTIAFAWDKHNGIAIDVEHGERYTEKELLEIRTALRKFFNTYQGKLIYHGSTFDIKMLIVYLYMKDLLDTKGLLKGLAVMTRKTDCTKIITYLATNTTAGNVLGLKPNAFEFTGNYAKDDINDITLIPNDELLEYNLVDCLATWFVKEKHEPTMIRDQQQQIHDVIMIPSTKVIIHMELVGMPMDYDRILEVNTELTDIYNTLVKRLRASSIITDFEWTEQRKRMLEANAKLKTKVRPIEDFTGEYNPASGPQTQRLVYEHMGFPIEDKTKAKQPSTKAKVLKKHLMRLMVQYNIKEEELI